MQEKYIEAREKLDKVLKEVEKLIEGDNNGNVMDIYAETVLKKILEATKKGIYSLKDIELCKDANLFKGFININDIETEERRFNVFQTKALPIRGEEG